MRKLNRFKVGNPEKQLYGTVQTLHAGRDSLMQRFAPSDSPSLNSEGPGETICVLTNDPAGSRDTARR